MSAQYRMSVSYEPARDHDGTPVLRDAEILELAGPQAQPLGVGVWMPRGERDLALRVPSLLLTDVRRRLEAAGFRVMTARLRARRR